MEKIPPWLKIVAALLLFAALFGAARVLLWLDSLGSVKGGLD